MNDNTVVLAETLARRGGWWDAPALIDEVTGECLRHRDVHAIARHLADQFAAAGVRAGEHVGFAVGDRLEWQPAYLAVQLLGGIPLVLNPDLTWRAQQRQLSVLPTRFLLSHRDGALRLTALPATPLRSWRRGELAELARTSAPIRTAAPGPSRYYLYSSGSTGEPKAVEHSTDDLPVFFDAVGDCLHVTSDDTIVSLSQYYFTYGFNNQFVYPLFSGASVVLTPERRNPRTFARCLEIHGATLAFSVPSALAMLADHIADDGVTAPASLRALVSAGEPLPISLAHRLEDLWQVPVFDQIGSTEVGNAFCANGFDGCSPGSAGFVRPGYRVELRPVAEATGTVGGQHQDREIGAVWVAGPTVPRVAMTTGGPRELLVDGWLETKDCGYWDDRGGLVVVGRTDDFVHVGGISVSAVEIESAIRDLDGIRDCAVLASQRDGVSTLVALIVSDVPGADRDERVDAMRQQLRARLEPFQIPKHWRLVETIPRTASGKITRHRLDSAVGAES